MTTESGERRWEITAEELRRLRAALGKIADRHDLDAALSALASWAMALLDAAAIVLAVRDGPSEPAVVRALAGRGLARWRGRRLETLQLADDPDSEWLRVPIRLGHDDAGIVLARPRPGHGFDSDDAELLHLLAAQVKMAIAQDRADIRLAIGQAREDAAALERARVARDLHDQTAQQLVAIGRQLDVLALTSADPTTIAAIDAVHDLVDRTLDDVRRISRDLRPAILEDLGLAAGLEALAADAARSSDEEVRFRLDGQVRPLPRRVELALYRVAQEALANSRRHADAERIDVRLRYRAREVTLEVEDDGRGFATPSKMADLMRGGGLGVVGMHERAAEIGARFELVSAAGRGTRIRVRVHV